MTVVDLKEILETAKSILETNKKLVTPELVKTIKDFLLSIQGDEVSHLVVGANFNVSAVDVPFYIRVLIQILEIEEKLVATDLTDRIIRGIVSLENRPVVLRLVALLL